MRSARRRDWRLVHVSAVIVAVLVASSIASAGEPALVDPLVALEQRLGAGERPRDLASNPAFLALLASDCAGLSGPQAEAACRYDPLADPFLEPARWAASRGTHHVVAFTNRYGATLRGDLYVPRLPFVDPVTGAATNGPFPAVITLPGGGTPRTAYRWAAQGLAESGYVALSFDPEGYGESDRDPQPAEEFCDPDGAWTQPQEMGFVENGPCAGQSASDPDDSINASVGLVPAGFGLDDDWEGPGASYWEASPQLIFGAFDAADWLASSSNPTASLVDTTRLAIAGHSLGAYAAMMVANSGLDARLLAAASWDGYQPMDHGVLPSVPTMIQQSQQESVFGPRVLAPDPLGFHPTRATHAEFEARCVPSAYVVLGMSTHAEWAFAPGIEASRLGERVAFHQTLAWFDAFVKGAVTTHVRGDEAAQRASGMARLTAATFDGSADRASSGAGIYDPATGQNVPYAIAGVDVGGQLSPYFASERDPLPAAGCAPE